MTTSLYDPAKPAGQNDSLTSAVSPDGTPSLGTRYRIPPRSGVAVRVKAGQLLWVENTHGTQVCDFWAFLAADLKQFLSMSYLSSLWMSIVSMFYLRNGSCFSVFNISRDNVDGLF